MDEKQNKVAPTPQENADKVLAFAVRKLGELRHKLNRAIVSGNAHDAYVEANRIIAWERVLEACALPLKK